MIILFTKQIIKNILQQKAVYVLWILFMCLVVYAGNMGKQYVTKQNAIQQEYQKLTRESWEKNPDKHPHRMAHFGSFALRIKHPLSVIDYGMENYVGNAVFLEAHKQNTVNYSEASFSTGLLRMGDLSIAMLLQIILPLIIFFIGYNSIAQDRENGTLKIIAAQGANIKKLLLGRVLGLWIMSSLFFMPAFLLAGILVRHFTLQNIHTEIWIRFASSIILYSVFFWVIAAITVLVSARVSNAKNALIQLLGIWLLLAIVLPKTLQVLSNSIFKAPTKLQFEAAIEKDILQQGDSHNPDDPFFKSIKDSVLKKYGATKADSLPVNLGGIIGKAGERISAETYVKHYDSLTNIYRNQNVFVKAWAWVNPFTMLKNNAMALAGSDFEAYIHFQQQAENYRYALAQQMNQLQIDLISNTKPKEGNQGLHIDKKHFAAFKDFNYNFLPIQQVFSNEILIMCSVLFWLILSWVMIVIVSKRFKVLGS